jgi:cytochrome b
MDMNMKKPTLVWDFPTRAFHWLLALSFTGAFITADSERWIDVHMTLGYTVAGLIAFRLLWGLVGTRYARFASFAFGPRAVLAYVKSLFTREPRRYVGHNPAGSWAIYLLLALGLLAAATGYATYVELGGEEAFEDLHEGLANAMLALVFVHIAGVAVSSLLHRENLARAMVSGRKKAASSEGIRSAHRIIGAALVAGVVAFWSGGGGRLVPDLSGRVSLAGSAASARSTSRDHREDHRDKLRKGDYRERHDR